MGQNRFYKAHIFLLGLILWGAKPAYGDATSLPAKEFGLDTLVFTSSQPDTLEDSRMVNPKFFYTYFLNLKGLRSNLGILPFGIG